MDVFAAEDDGERGGEGDQVHGHVSMEKKNIQSHRGYRNQRKYLKFSDYGVAVGHHKRHGDYKAYNLPFSDLVNLLPDLF